MSGRIFFALVFLFISAYSLPSRASDPLVSTRLSNHVILASSKSNSVALPAGRLPLPTEQAIREVYVWAWPMVYLNNLKESLSMVRSAGVSGGAPVAPINNLCMLTNVVTSGFRSVPCPNPDVIYGFGLMDLTEQPVVLQVPELGDRFWLYQVGDHRMESFGRLGSLYGTEAGFYLVVGPEFRGEVPAGFKAVLRSPTNLAYILPRVFAHQSNNASATDANDLTAALEQIVMYPLSKYTGRMQRKDWSRVRWYPAIGQSNRQRNRLVSPADYFQDLAKVIEELPPSESEVPLVELADQLVQLSKQDATFSTSLIELAQRIESETIVPMFDFAQSGERLPGGWTTLVNGAQFGDDYWTRTAVAKSNPFVNRAEEAKYYYLEHDRDGHGLSGAESYRLTFSADQLPPTEAFWSLTLYNADHQLHTNDANRHSVSSWTPDLNRQPDGSITIVVCASPAEVQADENWLPSPDSEAFSLYLRIYAPDQSAIQGTWQPPQL